MVLEAATDPEGNVKEVKVVDGVPQLDQAAVHALKQWKYEPYTVNGVKKPVKFTVIVKFNLKKKEGGKTGTGEPVALSAQQRPKLVKKVNPQYPEEAVKAGVQGKVVIEAVTDHQGRVTEAKIIDGVDPILNDAALKAIKQWQYEPYIIAGVKKAVKFTVVLNFNLKEKPKQPEDKK